MLAWPHRITKSEPSTHILKLLQMQSKPYKGSGHNNMNSYSKSFKFEIVQK